MKKGDYVLVTGEADEVFQILSIEKTRVLLKSGFYEPIEKCTVVPDKYKDEIYSIIKDFLPYNIIEEILKEKS